MNKLLILTCLAALLLPCCKKAAYIRFQATDNIYFNFNDSTTNRDSVIYSFAYTPGKESDTLYLPVRISGNRTGKDRQFVVAVTDSGTTAVAGLHYVALKSSYLIPAGAGLDSFALILLNSDTMLTKRSVSLNLHLVATDDLGVQLADMIKARIIFSNKFEKPVWWDLWMNNYSDAKFELFIIASGVTVLQSGTDYGLYAPQSLYYIGLLQQLLDDPFAWVSNNPEKGYVLELRADGDYDFYNTAIPSHRLLVKKDPGSGKYFFIDEKGAQVI